MRKTSLLVAVVVVLLLGCSESGDPVDFTDKDQARIDRWTPRLPRIRGGARRVDLYCPPFTPRLFVDASGRSVFKGVDRNRETLLEQLFQMAETRRSLDHADQPTTVCPHLFLDRDLAFAKFRELLLDLTDPALRYRWFFTPVHLEKGGGLPGEDVPGLMCSFEMASEAPARELVLRAVAEAEEGEDLAAALTGAPGVRIRCGPEVKTERLLEVLFVLAQVQGLDVVLDLRDAAVPEAWRGTQLDGRPVRMVTFPEKGDPDVDFRILRNSEHGD